MDNLSVDDLWNLIEDKAGSAKQDQAMRLEELANMVHQIRAKTELWVAENELAASTQQLAADIQQLNASMHQNQAEAEESWAIVEAAQKETEYLINEMRKPRVIKEEPTEPAEPLEPVLAAELPKSDTDLSVIAPGDQINDEDEDPWLPEEELHSDYPWELEEKLPNSGPVLITNLPEEITPVPDLIAKAPEETKPGPVLALGAPEEVPDLNVGPAEKDQDAPELPDAVPFVIAEAPKTSLVLMAEAPELPETDPVLTDGLVETGPVLVVEVPQLDPSFFYADHSHRRSCSQL